MARRREQQTGSLDSLLDTMTNVVGILVILLVVTQLGVSSAVKRIRSNLEDVSPEQSEKSTKELASLTKDLRALESKQTDKSALAAADRKTVSSLETELKKLQQSAPPKAPSPDSLRNQIQTAGNREKATKAAIDKTKKDIEATKKELAQVRSKRKPPAKVVRIPDPRPAPQGAKPEFFVCMDGRVMPLNTDAILEMASSRITFLKRQFLHKSSPKPALGGGLSRSKKTSAKAPALIYDRNKIEAYFKKKPLNCQGHSVTMYGRDTSSHCYTQVAVSPRVGEDIHRIGSITSTYRKALKRVKADKKYIRFFVHPDSFEVYLKAREIADQAGIAAGWSISGSKVIKPWQPIPGVKVHASQTPPPPTQPAVKKPPANVLD